MSELYRVGRHQPQNVYRGEKYIGVMFSPEDAAAVVRCLNLATQTAAPEGVLADHAFESAGGMADLEHCEVWVRSGDEEGTDFGHICGLRREQHRKGTRLVALIDRDGDRFDHKGNGIFTLKRGPGFKCERQEIERDYGPVTEVWE